LNYARKTEEEESITNPWLPVGLISDA